jgi:hypothetical protein
MKLPSYAVIRLPDWSVEAVCDAVSGP